MRRALCAALGLLLPAAASAQEGMMIDAEAAPAYFTGPHFWVAIVAGVLLAIGFQLLLTNVSLAAGITAAGPFDRERHHDDTRSEGGDGTTLQGTVRKITSGFGIWATVTSMIALFFASWLAVELSFTLSELAGAVLGLVIWALFYTLVTLFEVTAASSAVGALTSTAMSGLRGAWKATSGALGRSPEHRAVDAATEITRAVKGELTRDVDTRRVRRKLEEYVSRLAPQRIDPNQVRKQVVELLKDLELHATTDQEGFIGHEEIVAHLQRRGFGAEDAKHVGKGIQSAVSTLREEAGSEKHNVAKVTDAAMRVGGLSGDDARRFREQVEEALRRTGRPELDPNQLEDDLEKLIREPSAGMAAMRDRLQHLDRDTLKALLAQRDDIDEQRAEQIVTRVEGILNRIGERLGILREWADEARHAARGQVEGQVVEAGAARRGTTEQARQRVRSYLDSLERPELSYDSLSDDLHLLMDDPQAGAEVLLQRLRSMDRNTLRAVIASTRKDMDEDDAEQLLERIESARDTMVHRVEQVVQQTEERIEQARREALHQADEARKTAATAAWWTTIAATLSGGAAVAGGIVGALTGF